MAIGTTFNHGFGTADSGHVRVFEFDSSTWVQVGAGINVDSGRGSGVSNTGSLVSLSAGGNRVAIGSIGKDMNRVHVFEYSSSSWNQLGSSVTGDLSNDNPFFMTLSPAGNHFAFGAYVNNGGRGRLRVYEFRKNNWVHTGPDIDGFVDGDNNGISASFSYN